MISVVIPVYNREHEVRRAIESVLAQTYASWELLIIDDCSTDHTQDSVGEYLKDSRIHYFRQSQNRGAAAARNRGIGEARYDYVSLLDSDDAFHPEFLKQSVNTVAVLQKPYGFTYCGVGDISEVNGREPFPKKTWQIQESLLGKKHPYLYELQFGTSAGITFKKEIFSRVGYFDETLRAAEDTEFFIRASEDFLGFPVHRVLIFKDNGSAKRLTYDY